MGTSGACQWRAWSFACQVCLALQASAQCVTYTTHLDDATVLTIDCRTSTVTITCSHAESSNCTTEFAYKPATLTISSTITSKTATSTGTQIIMPPIPSTTTMTASTRSTTSILTPTVTDTTGTTSITRSITHSTTRSLTSSITSSTTSTLQDSHTSTETTTTRSFQVSTQSLASVTITSSTSTWASTTSASTWTFHMSSTPSGSSTSSATTSVWTVTGPSRSTSTSWTSSTSSTSSAWNSTGYTEYTEYTEYGWCGARLSESDIEGSEAEAALRAALQAALAALSGSDARFDESEWREALGRQVEARLAFNATVSIACDSNSSDPSGSPGAGGLARPSVGPWWLALILPLAPLVIYLLRQQLRAMSEASASRSFGIETELWRLERERWELSEAALAVCPLPQHWAARWVTDEAAGPAVRAGFYEFEFFDGGRFEGAALSQGSRALVSGGAFDGHNVCWREAYGSSPAPKEVEVAECWGKAVDGRIEGFFVAFDVTTLPREIRRGRLTLTAHTQGVRPGRPQPGGTEPSDRV
ncbi:unnamed protein product [Effrenium voratum]|nr:unnamed protein product [Effrenium voratum]